MYDAFDTFMYILLGIVDVMAIFALMFKIFRWTYFDYIKELLIIAVINSFASYLNRIVFEIPNWDLTIQFVITVVLLRYILRARMFESILMFAVGALSFMGIQITLLSIMQSNGMITIAEVLGLVNWGIYTLQIINQVVCFIVAWLLYRYNKGFSYIMEPPHDMIFKQKITRTDRFLFVAVGMGVLVLITILYLISMYYFYFIVLIPAILCSLVLLIYLSHRKDYGR